MSPVSLPLSPQTSVVWPLSLESLYKTVHTIRPYPTMYHREYFTSEICPSWGGVFKTPTPLLLLYFFTWCRQKYKVCLLLWRCPPPCHFWNNIIPQRLMFRLYQDYNKRILLWSEYFSNGGCWSLSLPCNLLRKPLDLPVWHPGGHEYSCLSFPSSWG